MIRWLRHLWLGGDFKDDASITHERKPEPTREEVEDKWRRAVGVGAYGLPVLPSYLFDLGPNVSPNEIALLDEMARVKTATEDTIDEFLDAERW